MEKKFVFNKSNPFFYTILFGALAVILVIVDQVTKWAAQNALLQEGNSIAVIPNFFYISLYHNTKVAFSLGLDGLWGRILNIMISIVLSIAIVGYMVFNAKKNSPFMTFVLCLLSAGAVGNMIDRIFYWTNTTGFDGVIDLFQFYLGGGPGNAQTAGIPFNPFPTFNMADAYLTVGVILFLVLLLIETIQDTRKRQKEENEPHFTKNNMEKGTLQEKQEDGKED